jgi:cysteine desulfurase/selenocysteine lyase
MPLDLARWLPLFPVRETCLYLNHASVAPLPRPVADAMRARIDEFETTGAHHWKRWRETELAVRSLTGQLLACGPDEVSIVHSTSEGISLVAQGLTWRKGDVVLVGEEEFAANVAPYLALEHVGVVVRRFPTPGGRIRVETLEPLLSPPVRLLALSWVAFHTGWVAPVSDLGRLCRERGILLVLDAIQGLGVLPHDFSELGVDALVADGHKWLLAPEGAGVLVLRPGLRERLRPVLAGWRNVKRPANSLFLERIELQSDGRRFEPGSLPTVLLAGLAAALELLLEAGIGNVYARVTTTARTLTHLLLAEGWEVVSPGSGHAIAGIVAGRHPFLPAEEAVARLRERHVEAAARQGLVRFSPHFYTTAGELDALRVILRKL